MPHTCTDRYNNWNLLKRGVHSTVGHKNRIIVGIYCEFAKDQDDDDDDDEEEELKETSPWTPPDQTRPKGGSPKNHHSGAGSSVVERVIVIIIVPVCTRSFPFVCILREPDIAARWEGGLVGSASDYFILISFLKFASSVTQVCYEVLLWFSNLVQLSGKLLS